jgi:hypothetical protein
LTIWIRDMATRTLEQLLLKVLYQHAEIRYTLDRTNPDLLVLLSTSTDLDTNITKEPVYATYPIIMDVHTVWVHIIKIIIMAILTIINWLVMMDLNTYKEGTLRLSLVDSKTKNIVWKARPQTVFIKAKMNLKLLQNLWMICSLNIQNR